MKLDRKKLSPSILKKFKNFDNTATVTEFIHIYNPKYIYVHFWYLPPKMFNKFSFEINLFNNFNKKRDSIDFYNLLSDKLKWKFFLYIITKM